LQSYHWPGNVRELENFIERAVILTQGNELQAPLMELETSTVASPLVSMEAMERAHIEEVLRHTNGVIAGKDGAARVLCMPASTLRSRMKKLGIR
jgi:transcriptional regulator with GAF, ATPase, and Fis domain